MDGQEILGKVEEIKFICLIASVIKIIYMKQVVALKDNKMCK